MFIRLGQIFWWGFEGGGYLSLSDRGRVTDGNGKWGRGTCNWADSGTDVGKWGAKGVGNFFFGPAEGGNRFLTPCVYTQNVQIFVENSNTRGKHEKNFDPLTRPPSRPLAAGPAICPLSLVNRGGGGGGWQRGGAHTAHHATFSTALAHQLLGSANAETTPARAPAAAANRKQRPDATCEGKNG